MAKSILFVRAKSEPASFKAVRQAISQSKGLESAEATSFADAAMIVKDGWAGLLVLVVSSKEDLTGVIDFLMTRGALIKVKRTARVVVFNSINNSKVFHALANLGCAEVIDFKVGAKAVLLKLERHLKLIRGTQASTAGAPVSRGGDARAVNDREKDSSAPKFAVEVIAPLGHSADYWLIHPKPAVKRIRGRWLVELIGPGPSAGQWVPIPIKGGGQKSDLAFQWKLRDPEGKFRLPQGRWVFIGREVDFVWRENRWRFVGDQVSLSFHEGDQIVARRFHSESAALLKISGNSEAARAMVPAIEETFGGSLRESRQGDKTGSDDGDVESGDLELGEGDSNATGSRRKARGSRGRGRPGHDDPGEQVGDDAGEGELSLLDNPSEAGPGSGQRPGQRSEKKGTQGKGPAGLSGDGDTAEPEVGSDPEANPGALDGDASPGSEGGRKRGQAAETPAGSGSSALPFGEAPDWNDRSDTPDPELPAFNDHGARPQNVFNFGRGLGQGHGKTRILYEQEEFDTGVDAFKPVGIQVALDSVPGIVLEDGMGILKLRLAKSGYQASQGTARLEVVTENMEPSTTLSTSARVVKTEPEEGGEGTLVEVEIDPEAREKWSMVQAAIAKRQEGILSFLKRVKGA